MNNLEQIRAKNALAQIGQRFTGKNDGEIIKKVPTMIMENGILGALAFAIENNSSGYTGAFKAIIQHLKTPELKMNISAVECRDFAEELADSNSSRLRAITAESLAYLNYLRRFAKKGE